MNINNNYKINYKTMRLIKNNAQVKSVKNKINKNKSIIDEINNMKYKIEAPFFQDKIKKNNNIVREKLKEKAFKDSQVSKKVQSNTNIYKPNKNIQNKSTTQIKKNLDKKSVYSKNKTISLNTNNNINIGNNINIITNNHIHENNRENKEENLPNNNLITNNTNQAINTDFYINKKSSINEFYNNNNDNIMNNENRLNRIREAMGYKARRFKGKNISMEHRDHKFGRELLMSDGDLMTDEDNIDIRKNYRLYRPYKLNSPTEFYNKNLRHRQFKSSNENNLFTNNINNINNNYFYNKAYDNMDEGDIFYNKYNPKTNDAIINRYRNRYKYNTSINYKNPVNTFYFNSDFQNQTTNGFYIHKTPMNARKRINKNLITNKDMSDDDSIYTNYLNYLKNNGDINTNRRIRRNHSVIEENNMVLSPYKNYVNTNYNYLDNLNIINSNRRSKNRVKIIKKNNSTSIQEYNLSVAGDDDDTNELDEYRNKFLLTNNIKNGRMSLNLNDNKINNNEIFNENIGLKKYYDNFKKNIQPITNTQFNINSSISQINATNENFNNFTSTNKKNSNFLINENTISNSKSTNNLGFTPNFSDTGKTPTRANNIINTINTKIRSFEEEMNEISPNSFNNSFISKNNNDYKLTSQKKQKEEDPTQSSGAKRKNSFSLNINKNLNKIVNNNFEIYHNDNINYYGIEKEKNLNSSNKKKNNDEKFVFENENDIIDYIYNKFEEERKKKNYFNRKLRFTGFVLSKKYKGKNLYDVRIEDNIDKINQQLKDEQILISNKQVEFRFTENEDVNDNGNNNEKDNAKEDNEKLNNELDKLNEENQRLKAENDKLNKKDLVKNGLIKKLDYEKQNFLEEIKKLKEEIEELKNSKINKEKKDKLYEIENNNFFDIKSNINNSNNKNKNKNIEEDSDENTPNILYNFKVTFNKIQKGKITKSNKGINDKKKEKEKSEFKTNKKEKDK